MDFERTRGKNAETRCTEKDSEYGSALYCECGCQVPRSGDEPNITGLIAKWTTFKAIPNYVGLYRDDKLVGEMDWARDYMALDGNEYMGVKEGSKLAFVFKLPVLGIEDEVTMSAGSTLAGTAAQEKTFEKIQIAEMDDRLKEHPGYCRKCHSYCYGDCEA